MKRLSSILLSVAMIFTLSTPAFASDSSAPHSNSTGVIAYSPEFPDAYLEFEDPTTVSQASSLLNDMPIKTVTVTAFWEEAYIPETGEVLYSRLMNKDEVDAWRAAGSPTDPVPLATWGGVESRGELDISLMIFQLANDGSSNYNTNLLARGEAYWAKGPSWGAGSTRPSWGGDIIGISWGKGLDAFNRQASAVANTGDSVDISLCDWDDTEFVAWEVIEQFGPHIGPIGGPDWAQDIQCSTGLGVPTSVYNQSTDIALTYAHSYADSVIDDVSISVEVSADGPTAGLDISFGTEANEWTIIAIADNVDL